MQKDDILAGLIAGETDLPAPAKKRDSVEVDSCNHWTRPILLERAAWLRKLARFSEGAATDTLRDFATHSIHLSVRLRSSPPEIHEDSARLLIVLEGRASLVTGGTLMGQKQTARNELTGTSIDGGSRQELRPGDVVHIPAGTPHQLELAGESAFTCLVLKINE